MSQATDIYGAADFLKITVATARRRIKAGTFPAPDAVENDTEWWELESLDRYQKALRRKKARKTRAKKPK